MVRNMKYLSDFFKHKKVLLPVIHVQSLEQATSNAQLCKEAGADGIFLINHRMDDEELLFIAGTIRLANKDWWVGVNCLGMTDADALSAASGFDGVWTDNAYPKQDYERYSTIMEQQVKPYGNLYFGGVAFKYQKPIHDLEAVCGYSKKFIDVVTTSGPATGAPPNLDKIQAMRNYLGEHPLAIASGIDLDNIETFLPYVDCYLVSTGISIDFHELDPVKVKVLAEKVHQID